MVARTRCSVRAGPWRIAPFPPSGEGSPDGVRIWARRSSRLVSSGRAISSCMSSIVEDRVCISPRRIRVPTAFAGSRASRGETASSMRVRTAAAEKPDQQQPRSGADDEGGERGDIAECKFVRRERRGAAAIGEIEIAVERSHEPAHRRRLRVARQQDLRRSGEPYHREAARNWRTARVPATSSLSVLSHSIERRANAFDHSSRRAVTA